MTRRAARRRLTEALGQLAYQLTPGWVDEAAEGLRLYTDPDAADIYVASRLGAAADLVWAMRRRECAELADRVRGGR